MLEAKFADDPLETIQVILYLYENTDLRSGNVNSPFEI